MQRRILAIFLALALAIVGLAGCGKKEMVLPEATVAKGRYVEQSIDLPAEGYPMDMTMLSDGRIRVGLMTGEREYRIFTRTAEGGWTEDVVLPEAVKAMGYLDFMRFFRDGSVFLSGIEKVGEREYHYHFAILSADGVLRELPITYPEVNESDGILLGGADITSDDRLMLLFSFDDLREVNLTDGSLSANRNELGICSTVGGLACAGEDTYLLSDTLCGRVSEGQQEQLTDALGKQLMASEQATSGAESKITFWKNEDGYLFFTTDEGLYSYVPGGSVTEELISASKSSFGDPSFVPKALEGTEDGVFYVLGQQSGIAALCSFVYDAEAPVQATNQLKVYSLYDDDDLRQMISWFQKSHPETEVSLEIGLTGEDGMTEADALRTLNTEILAGSGPDILRLDGMSLDSYLEKDILMDLSDLLAETPTLEQITKCYERDGKVCVIPAAFAIPAVYGPRELVTRIANLDSLVDAASQALAQNDQAHSLMNGMIPQLVTDTLYDSCSAAWKKADGTLDEEALERFLEAMDKLYAMDAPLREQYADILKELEDQGDFYTPGEYTGIGGSHDIIMNGMALSAGTLEGMEAWSYALAGDDRLEDYALLPLNLQASGVFLPRQLYGALASSENGEAAKDFVRFVLGEEVQGNALSFGFPVNQAVFDRQIQEDKTVQTTFGSSDENGNYISLAARYPSAAERQQLVTWVNDLTTPALTDRTIRSLITAQAAASMKGSCTVQEAVSQALQSLNLYLSE